jgi:hypothetical protein
MKKFLLNISIGVILGLGAYNVFADTAQVEITYVNNLSNSSSSLNFYNDLQNPGWTNVGSWTGNGSIAYNNSLSFTTSDSVVSSK